MDSNTFFRRIFQYRDVMSLSVTQAVIERSAGISKEKIEEIIAGINIAFEASYDQLIQSLVNLEKREKEVIIESSNPTKTTKTKAICTFTIIITTTIIIINIIIIKFSTRILVMQTQRGRCSQIARISMSWYLDVLVCFA